MQMKRISMDLKKEIQFLKPLLKHQRKVARKLGISREAVVYANTLYDLGQNKMNQHSSLNADKFYFFIRKNSNGIFDFIKSFKPFYPHDVDDMSSMLALLNG